MRKKILVVEDNEYNLYLVGYLLEKGGYEVITAQDGPNAVEKAKKKGLISSSWTSSSQK